MSETGKISVAEWWQYKIRTAKRAWSDFRKSPFIKGRMVVVIIAVITAGLTYPALIWAGVGAKHETAVRCIVSACAALMAFILVMGIQFLIKLLAAPAKMDKESEEKLAAQQKAHATEKQKLNSKIEKLESELVTLEIEFINPTERDALMNRWPLRVKVTHDHPTKTAKNVRVLLTKIVCLENYQATPLELKKANWPVYLPETGSENSLASYEVPPKLFEKTFDVFMVRQNLEGSSVWVAPIEQPNLQHRDFLPKIAFLLTKQDFPTEKATFEIGIQVTAKDIGTLSKTVVLEVPIYAITMKLQGDEVEINPPPPPRWIV